MFVINIYFFTSFLVFIFGSLYGSFLNVVILRIPANEEIIHTPSHCPACGHSLSVTDLVPIFSYLFFRGKCRYCKVAISAQYAIIEFLTATCFLLSFRAFPFEFFFLIPLTLGIHLLMWGIMSTRTYQIPATTLLISLTLPVLFLYSTGLFTSNPNVFDLYLTRLISSEYLWGIVFLVLNIVILIKKETIRHILFPPLLCWLYLGFACFMKIELLMFIFFLLCNSLYLLLKRIYNYEWEKETSRDEKLAMHELYRYLTSPFILRFAALLSLLLFDMQK
ncbi:prepilin peptidase [Candidatus Riflebacteria bacterium]